VTDRCCEEVVHSLEDCTEDHADFVASGQVGLAVGPCSWHPKLGLQKYFDSLTCCTSDGGFFFYWGRDDEWPLPLHLVL